MKHRCRLAAAAALAAPFLLLSGCRFTTRHLPVPKAPSIVQTVTPQQLVDRLNERWNSLQTLNATVEIQASALKTKEGVEKDYTTFPAIILLRKPGSLRVFGRVPVIGTRMFDMVSDGKDFKLYIPSKNLVYEGPNSLDKESSNQLENMRPGFFFNAMAVRGLEPDDEYMVTADTDTMEDASKKHLLLTPEYILSVMRRKQGSRELTPMRVITFHREDLLPYQQDIYDSEGNLQTQVFYSRYATFGTIRYPSRMTIKLPLEDYQIILTVQKVVENRPLSDEEFQIKLPEGTQVQTLE